MLFNDDNSKLNISQIQTSSYAPTPRSRRISLAAFVLLQDNIHGTIKHAYGGGGVLLLNYYRTVLPFSHDMQHDCFHVSGWILRVHTGNHSFLTFELRWGVWAGIV